MNNIVLIGFMASGKSSVGREVARRLGYRFVDADAELERRAGCSVAEMFAEHGEEYFRQNEHQLLGQLLQGRSKVISTGGGVVTRPENIALLKNSDDYVIWLDLQPEEVLRRTEGDRTRPLLQAASEEEKLVRIRDLMDRRRPLYEAAAHHCIQVGETALFEVVRQILKIIQGGNR